MKAVLVVLFHGVRWGLRLSSFKKQNHPKSTIECSFLGKLILCTEMFIKIGDLFPLAETGLVMSLGFCISIRN